MPAQTVLKRIERAEEAAKAQSRFSPNCICFPRNEPPFVGFPVELEIAAGVKCPLHGDRVGMPHFFIYVSKWLREKIWTVMLPRRSEQFRKAWDASFPPNRWPAVEEETEDGWIFLVLKDGTKYLAYMPSWDSRRNRTKEEHGQPSC